jgi:hypothetical protein
MIKLSKGTVVALTNNYGLAANIGALAILKKIILMLMMNS